MSFKGTAFLLSLLQLSGAALGSPTAKLLGARAPAACGETAALVCYGRDGGTSQDVAPAEIIIASAYLRSLGETASVADSFWTMPSSSDCEEWMLPLQSSNSPILVLAKHINPRIKSSVLYEDIATTIDGGGLLASEEDLAASLLGCGRGGGMVGVRVNTANPLYESEEYKGLRAKPEGILIKIVRNPDFKEENKEVGEEEDTESGEKEDTETGEETTEP